MPTTEGLTFRMFHAAILMRVRNATHLEVQTQFDVAVSVADAIRTILQRRRAHRASHKRDPWSDACGDHDHSMNG